MGARAEALLHPISFTVSLALVVVLHILLGEMVPKNIALAGPEAAAMLLCRRTSRSCAWCGR